jgi:hypothetical protein
VERGVASVGFHELFVFSFGIGEGGFLELFPRWSAVDGFLLESGVFSFDFVTVAYEAFTM